MSAITSSIIHIRGSVILSPQHRVPARWLGWLSLHVLAVMREYAYVLLRLACLEADTSSLYRSTSSFISTTLFQRLHSRTKLLDRTLLQIILKLLQFRHHPFLRLSTCMDKLELLVLPFDEFYAPSAR